MKLKSVIQFFILFFFALALCLYFSSLFNFWYSYGFVADPLVHYDLAGFYSKYFPHINWWSTWGAGSPIIFFYPKTLYLFETALRTLTHWDMQFILYTSLFTAVFLAGIFTALAIKIITKSWLLSLVALPFFYGSPLLWEFRNFARGLAYVFLPLTILFSVWYLEGPSKRRKIVLIIVAGISSLVHPFIGALVIAATVCFLINFKKIKDILSIIIPVLIIASTYYLPIKFLPGFSSGSIHAPFPFTINHLLYLTITPYSFIISFVSLLALIIFARKRLEPFDKTILKGALLFCLGLLVYFFTTVFKPVAFFYINGFPYYWACIYMLPGLAIITGISLKALFKNLPQPIFYLTCFFVFLLLLILAYYPLRDKPLNLKVVPPIYGGEGVFPETKWKYYESLLGPPPGDNQYHYLQIPSEEMTSLYLNIRYDIPDIVRSLDKAIKMGADWFSAARKALGENGKDKFFYLDWFGVKYLINITNLPSDLINNHDVFTVKLYDQENKPFAGYLNHPKPNLEATSVPNVLFIGNNDYYAERVRDLAYANTNSSILIPVKGPPSLSDISPAELAKFDIVWLYGYEYKENHKTADLVKLANYVKAGGGLVIDTGFGLDSNAQNLPDPFPINQTFTADITGEWQIEKVNYQFNDEVDFSRFSVPVYEEGEKKYPWKISTTNPTDIKSWANLALISQGKPIVVTGQFGAGKVIWTGFNLHYHITQYHNEQESLFLKDLLLWTVKDKVQNPPQYSSIFVNPEKREAELNSPAKGVILRDYYYPNWKVKVNNENEPLYMAGPGLMYVNLVGQNQPVKVIFYYQKSFIEVLTSVFATFTVIFLLISFIKIDFPEKLFSIYSRKLKNTPPFKTTDEEKRY